MCLPVNRTMTVFYRKDVEVKRDLFNELLFKHCPVSFYDVDYCTDALCIKDGVKIDLACNIDRQLIYKYIYTLKDLRNAIDKVQ